jgi:hypothetical protein
MHLYLEVDVYISLKQFVYCMIRPRLKAKFQTYYGKFLFSCRIRLNGNHENNALRSDGTKYDLRL